MVVHKQKISEIKQHIDNIVYLANEIKENLRDSAGLSDLEPAEDGSVISEHKLMLLVLKNIHTICTTDMNHTSMNDVFKQLLHVEHLLGE